MLNLNESRKEISELITNCSQTISGRREIAGEFCGPFSPALFIMLGSACEEANKRQIHETVQLGWNSLNQYIQYLEYPGTVSFDTLVNDADAAVTEMKKAPQGAFRAFSDSKMYIYLELADENIEEYLELFRGEQLISDEINGHCQVILFVMVDETERKKKKKMYSYIREIMNWKKNDRIAGAMFLSNVLRSGRILSDTEQSINYRLAADVAYVSDSYDLNTLTRYDVSKSMESDILKDSYVSTAAYIQLSKPSEAIAKTILRAMVNQHLEQEADIIKGFDSSKHEFFNKLNPKSGQSAFGLEEIYKENIRKQFPGEVLYKYLPYSPDLDKHKGDFQSVGEVKQLLSGQARSVLQVTEYHYFNNFIREYVNENKELLCQLAEQDLREKFPYTEFLQYCEKKEQLEEIRKEIQETSFVSLPAVSGGGPSAERLLWEASCMSGRKYFYKLMGPICLEVFDAYLQKVQNFKEIVDTVSSLLNQGLIEPNILTYYTDFVKMSVNYHNVRKDYLKVCGSVKEWCAHLGRLFRKMVDDYKDKLDTTFEKELDLRLHANSTSTIMEELGHKNKRLAEECRLEYGNSPDGPCYCMAYAGANFVNAIEEHKNEMGSLFTSSRQDSVERLMICSISCDMHYFDGDEEEQNADSE